MKKLLPIAFMLIIVKSYGQDGSDMEYVKIKDLNESYVGKFAHLDFFRPSRARFNLDSVTLLINDSMVNFREVRNDDGFNNWFSNQYLQSDIGNGMHALRIEKLLIKQITQDAILATAFIIRASLGVDPLEIFRSEQDLWIKKSIIYQVLIKI